MLNILLRSVVNKASIRSSSLKGIYFYSWGLRRVIYLCRVENFK